MARDDIEVCSAVQLNVKWHSADATCKIRLALMVVADRDADWDGEVEKDY